MTQFKRLLAEQLGHSKKIVILGVGSPLKSDDAAGILIAGKLKEQFPQEKYPMYRIYVGESAPENYTGEIKNFLPEHLIVLDAADINEEPGSVGFIDVSVIKGISFCTHMLPLNIMLDYIQKETGCAMTIIGIQPENLSYDGKVTLAVKETIEEITNAIGDILTKIA
ncbi:MAG: hypothetical protein BGN88_08205 [Clostridiales bacterium 43-6]|nr:MAG: hypothetical protein BGN88_08205 [Clostridiales bacterium 43-6]